MDGGDNTHRHVHIVQLLAGVGECRQWFICIKEVLQSAKGCRLMSAQDGGCLFGDTCVTLTCLHFCGPS